MSEAQHRNRTGDPNQPGYVPPPVDPSDDRNVGKGREFGADLQALYLAGRVSMPDVAQTYSRIAAASHALRGRLDYLADTAGGVGPMRQAAALLEELGVATFRTATALRDTGTALVRIADDYVTTDEAARTEFMALNKQMGGRLDEPTPQVTPPPSPSSPVTPYVPYEDPSLADRGWDWFQEHVLGEDPEPTPGGQGEGADHD